MIIDLDELPNDTVIKADLCIVGSGAAGLSVINEFINSNFRVIVLESGAHDVNEQHQSKFSCRNQGLPFVGAMVGRYCAFGGSTTAWGGQSIRFSELDFQEREYIADSGWPIALEELVEFYELAESFLGLDSFDYSDEIFPILKRTPLQFNQNTISHKFSKWTPQPNIKKLYSNGISNSANIKLILNAHVSEIKLNRQCDEVTSIDAVSINKTAITVKPRYVALCAGGIENARILLYSNSSRSNGIGNDEDLVGRYFQDHSAIKFGEISPYEENLRYVFATTIMNKTKYTPRFSLSEFAQREFEVLSASGNSLMLPDSIFDNIRDIRLALVTKKIDLAVCKKMLTCIFKPELYEIAANYILNNMIVLPKGNLGLNVLIEQEPNRNSRITIDKNQLDFLGLPIGVIDWKLTKLTGKTLGVYADSFKNGFESLGLGKVSLDQSVFHDQDAWLAHVVDQAHHIGTTRMHNSPKKGVVDADCKVHGLRNLYICGSSVFPTGSHSSPTLTLVALSIRLAKKLHNKLTNYESA